jgi:hypothetical protein
MNPVADLRNLSASFRPAADAPRSHEFDASIFEQVASLPPEDDVSDDDEAEADEPPSQREGLPPGFRMRHDAHYVEELLARNRASRVDAVPTDADSEAGGDRMREAAAALPMTRACVEVGQSLDAIDACLRLFPRTARPASERAALDMIGAEVCRATWLLQALALLDEDSPVATGPVDLGRVASRVARGLMCGRHHAPASLDGNGPGLRARGDERLLALALAGMVMALQAAIEPSDPADVEIRIRTDADRVVLEAAQEAVRLPASWRRRFLDSAWTERPGGGRVTVALAASRRVAELHRGSLTIADAGQDGSRLVLSLPRT